MDTRDGGVAESIVFFVDELARCRPTYSIVSLERIRHFFDVAGLVSVLALDKDQWGHSIRGIYETGIDVDGYLRWFIDVEYRLPKVPIGSFVAFLSEQYQLREILQKLGAQIS